MTQDEMKALGMSDAELEAAVMKWFAISINLVHCANPSQQENMRGNWYRQVMEREMAKGKTYDIGGEKMGSFGENNPEQHFGAETPAKKED